MNTVKTCICLTHIGDNGPCPVHGEPPNAKGFVPPRMNQEEVKRADDVKETEKGKSHDP